MEEKTDGEIKVKDYRRQVFDETLRKEIDEAWDYFINSDSKIENSVSETEPGSMNLEKLEKGVKLVNICAEKGILKFIDIVKSDYAKPFAPIKDFFKELKGAYAAYYELTSDEEAAKMDVNIRGIKYEDIFKIDEFIDTKELSPLMKVHNSIQLGEIAKSWIDYLRNNKKAYYLELKKEGLLKYTAQQKEQDYLEKVEELEATGKYSPGGAGEVARLFLY